jgi:hypothetical protein
VALCLGSPTSDKAVWGRSPDGPVWRDVIPDETEVAPGRNWPPNDVCQTRLLGGDRDRPYIGSQPASYPIPHGCLFSPRCRGFSFPCRRCRATGGEAEPQPSLIHPWTVVSPSSSLRGRPAARGSPMGRRLEEEGGSQRRPVIGRIGVEPLGEIIPRESGPTSLGCLRTRPSEPRAWETDPMTAAGCGCGLRRIPLVSPGPGSCRWGAGDPPGPARDFERGLSGLNRKVSADIEKGT